MSVDTSNRNLARLQHDLKHSLSNEVFAEARAVIHALQAERDAAVARYRHVIEILRRDGYWAALMDDAEIDAQVDAARGEK